LIGVNSYRLHDPSGATDLQGCVNDLEDCRRLCLSMGYPPASIHVLRDHDAKQANILAECEWLAFKLNEDPASEGVFSFSGPGSLYRGRPMLCPADLQWDSGLTYAKLGERLKIREGVNLSVFIDACHSGSRLRGLRNCSSLDDESRQARFIPPPEDLHIGEIAGIIMDNTPEREILGPLRDSYQHVSSDLDIVLTGCALDQTSADAFLDGRYCGAFTNALMKVLRGVAVGESDDDSYFRISYAQLLERMRQLLKRGGFDQTPEYHGPEEYRGLDVLRRPRVTVEDARPDPQP
jgi:hypothetical protein